jgi:uncharacterized protein (TIGR02996 family)
MSPEAGFLDALLDAPRELTPRLVYADWLEEFGGPRERARAELLRLQLAWFETRSKDRRRRAELIEREHQLLENYPGLAGPLERMWAPDRPLLSWDVALPAFLYGTAATGPPSAPLGVPSTWRGVLQQKPFDFPTKLTVTAQDGPRFTGRMQQDFSRRFRRRTHGRFSVEGVVIAGRLVTFVSGRIAGPTATPSLYLLWRNGDELEGTFDYPPLHLHGPFTLKRSRL